MRYHCIHCSTTLARSQTTIIDPDKEYRKCNLCGGTAIIIGVSSPEWVDDEIILQNQMLPEEKYGDLWPGLKERIERSL